jgi:hypothetical protein
MFLLNPLHLFPDHQAKVSEKRDRTGD